MKTKKLFAAINIVSVIIMLGIFVFSASVMAGGKKNNSGYDNHMNHDHDYDYGNSILDLYDRENSLDILKDNNIQVIKIN